MLKNTILFLCIIILLVSCAPRPTPHLQIDSKISKPFIINENILSTEPTIFVRSMSYESTGAKDLDALIEKRLKSSNHRLVNQSDSASIKLLAQLVYLGSAEHLDFETLLTDGYGKPIPPMSVSHVRSPVYEFLAVIDAKVSVTESINGDDQFCRILIGVHKPMPTMKSLGVRALILAKAADQVSVFFDY